MQGTEALVALRRAGKTPAAGVAIEIASDPLVVGISKAEMTGQLHVIRVNPSDAIDRLDLRSVVGLKVVVYARASDPQERTVRAVCAACVRNGAKRVIGLQLRDSQQPDTVPESEWLFNGGAQ